MTPNMIAGLTVLACILAYFGYKYFQKRQNPYYTNDLASSYRENKARDMRFRQIKAQYNFGIRTRNFDFLDSKVPRASDSIQKVENNVIHVDFSSRKRKSAS